VNIFVLNPLNDPHWDNLLSTFDGATFFHTSAWARVLSESYGYTPFYFTAIENGKLSGLIPVMEIKSFLTGKRGVSLPFSDMCEPLAVDQPTFKVLWEKAAAKGHKAGWKHIELRGGDGFLEGASACAQHLAHTLELGTDEAMVSGRFKPNIRRNIRKAEKEGVQVKLDHSFESIGAFYKLNCGTRRHHGLPPQPWLFFRKIYEHVIAAGKGFVALAEYKNQVAAGAVFTFYRDQAIYKYGASDRSLHRLRPNNLVIWEAIRWCCRKGIRSLNFGRTEPENEGLVQFKRVWGTTEKIIRYFKFDLNKNAFVADSPGPNSSYRLFKQMPAPVLRVVGNILYRHVG
jgi:hypothetical protein